MIQGYDLKSLMHRINRPKTWATNFSPDYIKEDTEDTEYMTQQSFTDIGFGFDRGYESIESSKIDMIDTVLVPADRTEEIEYTGTWIISDVAAYKFGRQYYTNTAGDVAIFAFSGVSCAVNMNTNPASRYYFTAEISEDDGNTWSKKKSYTTRSASSPPDITFMLYDALKYGDYKVRITNMISGTAATQISYFQYTTYMIQRPITQYVTGRTVAQAPPLTAVLNGTWTTFNNLATSLWNSAYSNTTVQNDTVEFKFYGDKIWVCVFWNSDHNIDISVLIDNVTTYNLTNTFNTDTGAIPVGISSWIRLDNGTLSDGEHTVKLTIGSNPGGQYFTAIGFGYYSPSSGDNTLQKPLITGSNSYSVGIDDTGFSFTGAGWAGVRDVPNAFLRRDNYTVTNGDYMEYTLPNDTNLKAVYLHILKHTACGEIKVTLDPGGTPVVRYLNEYAAYTQYGHDFLFDSVIDGVTLANKVLRIEKNGGTVMYPSGLTFEIDDTDTGAVELNSINVMPKWGRYNNSQQYKCPVSNSYRLEVVGQKTDTSEGRKPMVHSGWLYGNGTSVFVYSRDGILGEKKCYIHINEDPNLDTGYQTYVGPATYLIVGTYVQYDGGLLFANNDVGGLDWTRIITEPNHVI